ncbi:MAG: hypothetical protein JW955_02075 [Sedimentisphaerales bacterium]|nr:hypothetical protein [Sedimentisphaerales bacterium]
MEKPRRQSSWRREGHVVGVLLLILAVADRAPGWTGKDIGNPKRAGSASFDPDASVWTVQADGAGIGGIADSFHYLYQSLTGDGQILVRVTSLTTTHNLTRAGLMIRQTLDADSEYVFISVTPYGRVGVQRREYKGREPPVSNSRADYPFPVWLKLAREENAFTAYSSADGGSWTALETVTVPMRASVHAGLAVTSGSPGVPCEANADYLTAASQPDLTVRTDSEHEPAGRKLLDNNSATMSAEQTKSQAVGEGVTAIYHVRLFNDGLVADKFTVYSFRCGGDWDVRYEDLLARTDVTGQVGSAVGWTTTLVARGAWLELRLMVTPLAGADGDQCELFVRAMSSRDRTRVDMIRVVTQIDRAAPAPPWSRTYTRDSDFDEGVLANVRHEPQADQLQLPAFGSHMDMLPYIWVPNSPVGSVSKVDTETGRELGRYRICPPNEFGNPSRTTVDREGNCWVGNRGCGTVVKIGLFENGQWEDRNGSGTIETSQDLNNDGVIAGDEMLPWGQDECVLLEVVLIGKPQACAPGRYRGPYSSVPIPRAMTVDPDNNIWAGCFGAQMYYHIKGDTGEILKSVDVSAPKHTPYGAVMDANGILWSSGHDEGCVLRLDPADNYHCSIIPLHHFSYGLGLHKDGYLYVSGYSSGKLSRIRLGDPNEVTCVRDGLPGSMKGLVCTHDGDVWIANATSGSDAMVIRCTSDGRIVRKIRANVGESPTGLAVDNKGKVWVVDNGDEYIYRIDPETNEVELPRVRLPGTSGHYGYSDMTGYVTQNYATRTGSWTIRHNTMAFDSPLGGLWWDADVPPGTFLQFLIRSSNDQEQWSPWQELVEPCVPCDAPPGRYFEVKAVFKGSATETPVLRALTFCFDDPAVCARQPQAPRP